MSEPFKTELQSSTGAVLIRVPAGFFTMGSPESEEGHRAWERRREVNGVNSFYLGKTPVTQEQYRAVTGTNPTDHEPIADAPVDSVDWYSANEFCQKLTQLDREAGLLQESWEYRLPSEAEWEYACRAGSSEPWYGDPLDIAWHQGNSGEKPHPVGQLAANAWGFHDMLGNVWEWCQDWFWVSNPLRSARGGSYFNSARFCRAAKRWGWNPHSRGRYCGFRLLAAPMNAFDLAPPIDEFPREIPPSSIYDAIDANDFDLALRVIAADPTAIESVDGIPPPLHDCIYHDKPEMLEWLLDHGANIERQEQDYGSTPLNCAVVMRHQRIIRALVKRGADSTHAMERAQQGLAGRFEQDPRLDREGYREVVKLLQELGIGSPQ